MAGDAVAHHFGVAVCSTDWALGREMPSRARIQLEQIDESSAGFAWFLEGLQDLGEGDLQRATDWWRKAHASLSPKLTATRLALALLALGAWKRGALGEAILVAEEAIWIAERVGDLRTDAVALLVESAVRGPAHSVIRGASTSDHGEVVTLVAPPARRHGDGWLV